LLDLRNIDLPKISEEVNQFAGKYADAVNSIYNLNATLPALSSTTGSDTGLLASDSLGFTGNTAIGIVDSSGTLVSKIAIDFDNLTISVDGGTATSFTNTVGGLTSALNTALGSNGTASFADGKLSLSASTSGNGLVFDEPATGGSLRGDKAFAHFFGLNNLINSSTPTSAASGINGTDANGFTAGDTFTLSLTDGTGKALSTKTITIPSGTFNDIISAMNDTSSGFGIYGTFSMASDGSLKFTQTNGGNDYSFNMSDDTENRSTTSVSLGELWGLSDEARNSISQSLSVNSKISSNPTSLALATTDLTTTNVGSIAVGTSDSTGAQALFNASSVKLNFSTGPLSGTSNSMTLSDYMSSIAGDIGTRASNAETAASAAASFKTDAKTRLANSVGVNLDEELVKMTQFQQAYSASARMLKAADEMFQILLDAAG
jgi:flagellar hook-associated protein 1 FlgK